METAYIFNLKRIKGKRGIEVALKHNRREVIQETGHIDSTRTYLNYFLYGAGSAKDITLRAKTELVNAGIEKLRKNGVMAVEIIFSLPTNRHNQNTKPFFNDCLAWVQRNMQGKLLAFDVHLDEAAPHAHAVILPLIDGRMQGRDMIGNIGNLNRLRKLFYNEVATRYGLSKGNPKLTGQAKDALAQYVSKILMNDPVKNSTLWPLGQAAISSDPTTYAEYLGLSIQSAKYKGKSFVQIMTSTGHGEV